MRVNEIFTSIDGEGLTAGELATFIRFTGCNLRCEWCDTKYSFDNGIEMPIDEILTCVPENVPNVTLTGGEPLLQGDIDMLIGRLLDEGHKVNIETNGAVYIGNLIHIEEVLITMDYKLPSSKMESKMITENIGILKPNDVLKFVVGSDEDLARMKEVIQQEQPKCYIYISSVFSKIEPAHIIEWMKHNADFLKPYKVRFQLQLHKFIWNPNKRGV
jgi:7-carboxy-7-deazaguanine synthase